MLSKDIKMLSPGSSYKFKCVFNVVVVRVCFCVFALLFLIENKKRMNSFVFCVDKSFKQIGLVV